MSFFVAAGVAITLAASPVENLVWNCGANTQIKGDFLIAEVPQGEEKTGGIASAEIDLSEWDGKPVGASIVARGAGIA